MSDLSFTESLDQALELLEQGQPLEYCVRQFPEYADELRPLLQVSADLQALAATSLSGSLTAAIEPDWEAILADVPQSPPQRMRQLPGLSFVLQFLRDLQLHPFQRYAALAAAAIILVTLAMRGAEQSMPTNPLYHIKRSVERVQYITASSPEEKIGLRLTFAQRRLLELQTLAYQTQAIEEPLLAEVVEETREAVSEAKQHGVDEELYQQLDTLLVETNTSLNRLQIALPAADDTALSSAASEVSALRVDLQAVALNEAAPPPTTSGSTPPATLTPTERATRTPVPTQSITSSPVSATTPAVESEPVSPTQTPVPNTATPTAPPIISAPVVIVPTMPVATAQPVATQVPVSVPTVEPTAEPTAEPTMTPTVEPTLTPTVEPTAEPTIEPTIEPTAVPTATPTLTPTAEPTVTPTVVPTATPTLTPTVEPTIEPTLTPTVEPTLTPTVEPTLEPVETPTAGPIVVPPVEPTAGLPLEPTPVPTGTSEPTAEPTAMPTSQPTIEPTPVPTDVPDPSATPPSMPQPTASPTIVPTEAATLEPTLVATPQITVTVVVPTPTTEPTSQAQAQLTIASKSSDVGGGTVEGLTQVTDSSASVVTGAVLTGSTEMTVGLGSGALIGDRRQFLATLPPPQRATLNGD